MDYKDLTKKVTEASLGNARMTDIAVGKYAVAIEGEDKIFLVDEKKVKVPVTATGLAALRIVESQEVAKKIATTREARESSDYKTLQKALQGESGVVLSDKTRFNVVHRLRIIDNINDKPVYKNECYIGYPEYVKAARLASAMPSVSDDQKTARANAFTEASENLRKSGIKTGINSEDKNLQLLPVFTVTEG